MRYLALKIADVLNTLTHDNMRFLGLCGKFVIIIIMIIAVVVTVIIIIVIIITGSTGTRKDSEVCK